MPKKHGMSQTPEYKCWQQIKARCLNPHHRAYPDYGGRGVTIQESWIKDFIAFFEHVGRRPSSKHSLDRRNNSLGYQEGNLRWVTSKEQNNNRRPHRKHGVKVHRPTRTDGRPTNYKHGMVGSPEYRAWVSMKGRCLNPAHKDYLDYGGRGVTIHPPWATDFASFFEHIGSIPSPNLSLDRIDNDGSYVPGNVRWASKLEQSNNRRPCKTGSSHGNHKHGYVKSPVYQTWGSIKTRCFNSNSDGYPRYGGVGITVCQRWRDDFEAFQADMGPKPTGQVLLREDLAGNYSCGACPECQEKGWVLNCRWATRTEINRSRRFSVKSGKLDLGKVREIRRRLAAGERRADLAIEFGVGRSLIDKVIYHKAWADPDCPTLRRTARNATSPP